MPSLEKSDKSTTQTEGSGVERRRSRLPQPDFGPYKKANAYPGNGYFFVGHSYDVALPEDDNASSADVAKRVTAIKEVLNQPGQCIPVGTALANSNFCQVLTRFEQDLLHRLPSTALIGPAIDEDGHVLAPCFSVWREERRKPRSEQ
jgi:hypothetical protein